MSQHVAQQIVLAKRPKGTPEIDDFRFVEEPLSEVKDGQLLIRTLYISVDPYMRGRMSDAKSYVPPYNLNEPIAGGTVGEVVESKSPEFNVGDIVLSGLGWQTYFVASATEVRKVDRDLAPVSTALGILGMPGLTAYFGLLDIGKPQPNETVVVSGAAGAVGMIVGQIAKIQGARAVGIAGSDSKVDYLTNELGFDAAINYKTTGSLKDALQAACPNGVDVYFDNVGGDISDAVLRRINKGARIPICGQISLYNLERADVGPRPQGLLLTYSALMQGFIIGNYAQRFSEGVTQLAEWFKQGKLKYEETVTDGFENTVKAFLGLFTGENLGKQLVKVSEPSIR